jgi:hypothetical protein
MQGGQLGTDDFSTYFAISGKAGHSVFSMYLDKSGIGGHGGMVARKTHLVGSGLGQGALEAEGAGAQLPPAGVFISYEEAETGASIGMSGTGAKSSNASTFCFVKSPREA